MITPCERTPVVVPRAIESIAVMHIGIITIDLIGHPRPGCVKAVMMVIAPRPAVVGVVVIIPGVHPIGTMPAIARIAVGTPVRPECVIVIVVPGIGIHEHHLHVYIILILILILKTDTVFICSGLLPPLFCRRFPALLFRCLLYGLGTTHRGKACITSPGQHTHCCHGQGQ